MPTEQVIHAASPLASGDSGRLDHERSQPLINALDFDALAVVALECRRRRDAPALAGGKGHVCGSGNLQCEIMTPPLSGCFNLVYVLRFSDGVRWIARCPIKSVLPVFGDLERQQMEADMQIMRLIRSATTIPIPDVFTWSTTAEAIGAPFALMSFLEGTPLSRRWFDPQWASEEKHLTVLRNLAPLMAQLLALRFDRIGNPAFDNDGNCIGVTGYIRSFCQEEEDILFDRQKSNGCSEIVGPFHSMHSYLMAECDPAEVTSWRKSEEALLRSAIDSIPPRLVKDGHFYLVPPDFDKQNLLVDDDGNITGIIDWDFSRTLPLISACARYPPWLTLDWNPCFYYWDENADVQEFPGHSPSELSRYRRAYADAFASLDLPAELYSPEITRLSHIFEAIHKAVRHLEYRMYIVPKLLDHAFAGRVPFKYSDFVNAYHEGKADAWFEQAKEAFGRMWHAEWESGGDNEQ